MRTVKCYNIVHKKKKSLDDFLLFLFQFLQNFIRFSASSRLGDFTHRFPHALTHPPGLISLPTLCFSISLSNALLTLNGALCKWLCPAAGGERRFPAPSGRHTRRLGDLTSSIKAQLQVAPPFFCVWRKADIRRLICVFEMYLFFFFPNLSLFFCSVLYVDSWPAAPI